MAIEKSYARLGLFLVVVLVVILATALLFIQRLRSREVIGFVTYTTDNVSGLDVSSPVRFRGVSVGRVTDVRVDPRGNIVEIDFEVFLDRLNTIGMNVKRIRQIVDLGGLFPKLRAQVIGNPVTGEAYLLLDSPESPPPEHTCRRSPGR
jgi:phospholipid/cholesterol/gamma-HCH transport system substrate-binding protein